MMQLFSSAGAQLINATHVLLGSIMGTTGFHFSSPVSILHSLSLSQIPYPSSEHFGFFLTLEQRLFALWREDMRRRLPKSKA